MNTAVAKTVHVNGSEFFISTILLHCHRGCRLHTHLMQFNECKRRKYVGASYILDKREIEREKKYCWRDQFCPFYFMYATFWWNRSPHTAPHRTTGRTTKVNLIGTSNSRLFVICRCHRRHRSCCCCENAPNYFDRYNNCIISSWNHPIFHCTSYFYFILLLIASFTIIIIIMLAKVLIAFEKLKEVDFLL